MYRVYLKVNLSYSLKIVIFKRIILKLKPRCQKNTTMPFQKYPFKTESKKFIFYYFRYSLRIKCGINSASSAGLVTGLIIFYKSEIMIKFR